MENANVERHLHRCQNCGVIWGHGNMMAGDLEGHKCPKCGKAEWRIYSGGGSHAVRPARTAETIVLPFRTVLTIALIAASILLVVQGAIELLWPTE